jgi:hypothetical protein
MPRKPWVPREFEKHLFHELYIDETSQNDHRFLVLGGIIIPRDVSAEFEADMIEARSPRLRYNSKDQLREYGWSDVSKGDFDEYKRFLDAYFSFAFRRLQDRSGVVRFYCSVVNTQVHGKAFSKGKRGQIGFDREIYSHCMHVGRVEKRELFHVFPDHRSTTQPVEKLAIMLSRGIRRKGDKRDHPFRKVQFRYSHECNALQVSDVLIGAIAYRLNRHYDKANANADKKLLCDYVLKRTGLDIYISQSMFRPKPFGTFQLWYRASKR